MKKILSLLFLIAALAGCVQYSLVPSGPAVAGTYNFDLDKPWNKAPPLGNFAKGTEVWTVDGIGLDAMVFWPAITHGQALFKGTKSNPYPPYTAGMLPTDIEKWVESSLTKSLGEGQVLVKTSNLQPVSLAGKTAFEFELHYATVSNLNYSGKVLVIPLEQGVGLIMYRATSIHYYQALLPTWESLMKSLSIRAG